MNRLFSLSIRAQLILIAFILAFPAVIIIIYSGMQMRKEALYTARTETQRVADSIATGQQNLLAAAQQLIIALAQLPDVKTHDAAKVQPVLKDILSLNAQYSNIFMADLNGLVWATAVPVKPPFVITDRRYFKNALSTGHLSSGEFIVSRATGNPSFNLAYPQKNTRGAVSGTICVGFILGYYEHLLERSKLLPGTSYVLLDHAGAVLSGSAEHAQYLGKKIDPELFRRMQEGPDAYTSLGIGIDGKERIISSRRLNLPDEQTPYIYIRAGIPIAAVLSEANKTLRYNLALLTSFLAVAFIIAWLIGKRSIADRISLLENASRLLASGDLQVRVSDLISGGELGRLGQTFDMMAGQLAVREQALRESEEMLRAAVNVSQIGIFDHDQRTETIYWSPQQRKIHGWGPDEPVTLQLFLDLVHPEDLEPIAAAVRRAHDPAGDGIWDVEHRIIRRDGSIRWLKERSQTFFEGEGAARRPVRTVGAVLDITERKLAEEEKQKLESQLLQAQKMEAIGQLAGGVAHDFNNILSAIIGYGSIVQMKMQTDDPSRLYVDQILASAERAAGLTQSLLAFSRKQVINPKHIDLNDSIRKVEKFLSRIIGEDITLTTRLCAETLTIFADNSQIEQVLMNLATNARDAMPNGGKLMIATGREEFDGAQAITHSFGEPGAYAVLTLSDTGAGMAEQIRGKIFDPFFTTKGVGRGTGLGLSIVYGIVKQNNGHINVYSEIGKGTTFKIYLPIINSAVPDQDIRNTEVSAPLQGGTETILIAEDNEAVRTLTRKVLSESGYTVIEAADGDEALEKFAENVDGIRLIIIDVIMPKKNGREVYEEVKNRMPDIKVLFTSGYPADLIQKEGVLEKGLNFLSKPSSPHDILKKVREVLDQ